MTENNLKLWPFIEAKKLLKRFENSKKNECIFQTGYGPSGLPHIGTFGEVFRTTMVIRAFKYLTNTPTKLFEYMACGCKIVSAILKPVLRYDTKGVDFFNAGDVNGLAKSIITSLKSKKLDSLNYNQNKILNTYCWELSKSKITEVYEKIIK